MTWTFWTADHEYLESLEMEGENQLNYRVRNEVLHRADEAGISHICCILRCLVCIVVSCVYFCSCFVCIVVRCLVCIVVVVFVYC